MFENVQVAPPDPILGLTDAFKADPNPAKINLGVGVYQDAQGRTPVLASVKEAERRMLAAETSKGYRPIHGAPEYGKAVQELMFGGSHEAVTSGRTVTAHTPGGTGALRVAGDYLHQNHAGATVWLSDPTWANHKQIFELAGLKTATYPYFDAAGNALAFDKMLDALGKIPAGDVVLLHGCCHNPTGIDPTVEQWGRIADVLAARKALPLIDFAYQGFGKGLKEDCAGLLAMTRADSELLICSSFSKNFGLYNERVGALSAVAKNKSHAQAVLSQIKIAIRANYSNPPAHGASIVTTILGDAALRTQWEQELKDMRDRINGMRKLFVDSLKAKGIARDFSFITRQTGMFSFSGLNKDQVQKLRDKYAIYIVGSGRINVAGMNEQLMGPLCSAIAEVL